MLDKFWLICFFMSKYIKYTYVSTHNFVGNWNSKLFEVKSGHKKSSEVKQGSNPSIRRQIGPVGRNISNIHMFRLRILSEIDIQNYSRSYQVIKSHQRSNLSKTCQKRVKTGCLIQLYALYICFDSEFGREFKFIRPLLVKDCVQNWPILRHPVYRMFWLNSIKFSKLVNSEHSFYQKRSNEFWQVLLK